MYHDPESWALWKKGIIEDYESSTGLFIEAATGELALAWGEQVGQELLRKENGDASLIWRDFGYHCWLEDAPETSSWGHCLDFFQTVSEGEFPDSSEVGTKAYIRWTNSQTSSALPNDN
jgi:hypothetical protein